MPRKKSYLTGTDQFCGGGGNSLAARRTGKKTGINIEIAYALNHWPVAISTHNANFPETKHDCVNISSCDPRRYGSTDFLFTSPECTHQGYAGGRKKPKKQIDLFDPHIEEDAMERSRATMFDVPRFAEYHDYNYILVENVHWARDWVQYDNWIRTMHTLGYRHKAVFFNSMFSWPTPQSRDRMYVHFWKKGNKAPDLEFRPKAHCVHCGKDIEAVQVWKDSNRKWGVYGKRGQYIYCCPLHGKEVFPYYYAAINAIDITNKGKRIGDRKKPLAENTMRRIKTGKDKALNHPFFIQAEHSKAKEPQNVRSVFDVFPTQTTRQTLGFVFPFIVENKGQSTGRFTNEAFSKLTCNLYNGLLTPDVADNFISYYYGGSDLSSSIFSPHNTFATVQGSALIKPISDNIDDWYYRMINVKEGKRIMNFDEDYILHGDSKKQFMLLGNAVTPSAVEWQIERALETFN